MQLRPLKERDLRKCAKCGGCGKPLGQCEPPSPQFHIVTIQTHVMDFAAISRQTGLALMLGGNAALAEVMGADEDMTEPFGDVTFSLCSGCAAGGVCVLEIVERLEKEAPDGNA